MIQKHWIHYSGNHMFLLINKNNDELIANNVRLASSWSTRLIGLLSYSNLSEGEGLWIKPCKSIHTIGMRFNIDVIFLDRSLVIKKIINTVKPFRICRATKTSTSVVELPAGTLSTIKLVVGDKLIVLPKRVLNKD